MTTELWVSFNYGAWTISFSKTLELDFTPFFGMTFFESTPNAEINVEVKNNDYCDSIIQYDIEKKTFLVNVRNWWKRPVSDEYLDETIANFTAMGWTRQDSTNIGEFKALMAKGSQPAT